MERRREIVEIIKLIFAFLKNNRRNEFSINQIAHELRTRWDTTKKALELLKILGLAKEQIKEDRKNATRFWSFKIV